MGALTLTRKSGQAIVLLVNGKRIARIEMSHARVDESCRVRLTIDAPDGVRILREEIIDREPRKSSGDE